MRRWFSLPGSKPGPGVCSANTLAKRAPRKALLTVADDICGLHAQLMSSAELALWARVDQVEPDAVERALWKDRTLVKTWAIRGTLHALTARNPEGSAEINTWSGGALLLGLVVVFSHTGFNASAATALLWGERVWRWEACSGFCSGYRGPEGPS